MNKNLKKETLEFIKLNHFVELTKVQNEVLKYTNSRKDVCVLAKTGTGKTHAYLIPIMEMINPESNKTQVVICVPTRELAYQVYLNTKVMIDIYPELRIQLLSGGFDKQKAVKKLNIVPHIIIGTPGRLKYLFTSNALRVDFVQMFVIDEADMSLEYGFLQDIDVIFSHMVKNPEVLCFSATYPQELQIFIRKYLSNPKMIKIEDKKRDPRIEHVLVNCKHKDYKEKLLDILKGINPYICMIFANSREYAEETNEYLKENNIKALLLHGGLSSSDRQKAIKQLQNKKYTYVIASDVASRGIDIDGISHVVSMGLPKQLQFYTHRAGRTGRNEKTGICYLLYKESDLQDIRTLSEKNISFLAKDYKHGKWIETSNPTKKRRVKGNIDEKQIVKSLKRKNEKVKPNYKKKKTMQVEKIKKEKRRAYIKQKIKEERKERYKQNAREKYQ